MTHLKNISKRFAAFTLIELLVVISIIAILAGLTLQNLPGIIARGQITGVVGQYHNLFLTTQTASMDSQTAGGSGAFPSDITNAPTIAAWSNALVPAYLSANTLKSMLAVKGATTNTTVYGVGATNDSSTVFLSCANITSNSIASGAPFGKYGGVLLTLSGAAINVSGTNAAALAQTTNVIWLTTPLQ